MIIQKKKRFYDCNFLVSCLVSTLVQKVVVQIAQSRHGNSFALEPLGGSICCPRTGSS